MSRLLAIKWTNRETRWNQLQWRVKLERSVVANSAAWWELYQQVKLGRFAIRSGGFRGTQIVPDLWPDIYANYNFYGHRNRIINLPSLNTKWYIRVHIFFILQILYAYKFQQSVYLTERDGKNYCNLVIVNHTRYNFNYKIKIDVIVNNTYNVHYINIAFNKIQK